MRQAARLAVIMVGMAKLLLNLRNVPDDEADEVRGWLKENRIEFYETKPSPWGISNGGIWISDDDDIDRAKALMAGYQQQRREQALARQEAAEQDGTAETFGTLLRDRPWYVVGMVIAIIGILAMTVMLPQLFLR